MKTQQIMKVVYSEPKVKVREVRKRHVLAQTDPTLSSASLQDVGYDDDPGVTSSDL